MGLANVGVIPRIGGRNAGVFSAAVDDGKPDAAGELGKGEDGSARLVRGESRKTGEPGTAVIEEAAVLNEEPIGEAADAEDPGRGERLNIFPNIFFAPDGVGVVVAEGLVIKKPGEVGVACVGVFASSIPASCPALLPVSMLLRTLLPTC